MVRKAPATTKHKGSQHNETFMPGITESADFIQQAGHNGGKELDASIEKAAHSKSAGDIKDGYVLETNLPDYGVPSGVQLTENINEEVAEASRRETLRKKREDK